MTEVWKLGVIELAAAYLEGEADPVSVVEAYLSRIRSLDPKINCYVAMNPDVLREAEDSAARLKAGNPRSVLEGVPIAVKDNLIVRSMPTSWGSAVFADQGVQRSDELPVARLRDAGAIILGKTNTPEFAVEGYTKNRLYGVTGNAWNPALTPGGSSGGSVSAVAAGLAAAAIGTDGGGSIRRPAGYTGLFGLKPTIGAVPRAGGLPQVLLDFEVVGSLTRSTADLRVLYSIMACSDRLDPLSRRRCSDVSSSTPLRILYAPRMGDNPCDQGILKACDSAAETLRQLGHTVTRGELPFELDELNAFWPKFGQIGLAQMRSVVPEMASKASPEYLEMADKGEMVTAPELYAALEQVRTLRSAASQFFSEYDAIMTPSSAAQPWAAGQPFPLQIDDQSVGPRGHAIYTGWVNAAGLPGLNLPAPHHADGMPVGFQLVGDIFSEEKLLELGASYEAIHGAWTWPSWLDNGR